VSEPITILVGTMTGTAELVAQEVETALEGAGYAPNIVLMDHADASVFDGGGAFLVVCSTYGNGDVPDNAQAFYASVDSVAPDLSGVVYGVIALGDMTYKATFCDGGLQFDRLLSKLGARRAGEPLKHDASSGTLPEDVGAEWAATWASEDLAPVLKAA
jgi:MioC protein